MDPDRPHDDSDLSPEPTVASVLGLSGPIRFRLHGSTQKAHLLLKQSEDKHLLGGSASTNGVTYYSLFAQKRIEVKPGKEILLALEGKFGDRPILICGDTVSSGHEPAKALPPTKAVEEDISKVEPTKPSRTASPTPMRVATPNLPPKLRKAWMKSMQNRQPAEPLKPETREMAVQTELEYTSTGVGPLPLQYTSVAVGSPVLKYSHISIGTTPEPEPMSLVSSPQEPPTTQQAIISEAPRSPTPKPPTVPPAETQPGTSEPRQRSLSPMEMSSTPSSPIHPPTRQSTIPMPPPSKEMYSEQKQVDTPHSPPPHASHTTESPHPTWGTPALGWENTSWDRADTSRPKSPVSSTASSRGNVSPVPIPGLSDPVLPPPITTSEAASTSEPEPTKNEAATPVLPSSPIPSRDPQHTPSQDTKQEELAPRLPSQSVSSERSRSPSVRQHEPLSWDRPEPSSRPYREPFPQRGKHQDRIQHPPVTAPNNVQYRGMFEEGGSRDYGWNNASISATDSWGGPAPYDAPPEFEGYRTRGRPNGRGVSDQSESSKSSRPELRPLMSLSSGPADNPLGIRPSPPRKIRIPPRSALQRGKGESKKGAAIGSGWPKTKSNGGGPPLPGYPEEDSPITEYLPQRRPSGVLNGKPPPNFVHGHTIKATIQDVPKGPATPPRGVKRRLSPGPETPRIESWTPVHAAAVPGPNVRMGMIAFSNSGRYFAVSCSDRSVRIWDTHTYAELAKLAHVQSVLSVAWMENDSGVVSLGELGEINRWTKLPTGEWAWARMLDASGEFRPGDRPTCFAYMKDRIAVAYPQMGVKVWLWVNGMWQQQRSILRHHVTNIRFIEGGKAIIGGTSDCVLWYCQVPSGTLRACNLFSAGIDYIDVSPSETELLVSLMDNTACVVGVNGSSTEVGVKLNLNAINAGVPVVHGGIYLNQGNNVLYGDTRERMFKWGMNGVVVAELMKAIGVQDQYRIEAVASYDFADGHPCAGCIVMGTASGDLLWWRYHSNGEFERSAGSAGWYNKRYRYD